MKKYLSITTSIFTALALLCWLNFFANNTFYLECFLVECGFGWLWVTAISRILISLCFGVIFFNLINKKVKAATIAALFGLGILIFLTETLVSTPLGRNYADSFFTPIIFQVPLRLAFYFVVITLGLTAHFTSGKIITKKWLTNSFLISSSSLAVLLATLVIKPIYYQDFITWGLEPVQKPRKQLLRISGRYDIQKPVHLFYFSTSCDHCYFLYHQLRTGAEDFQSKSQVQLAFHGTQKQLVDFTHNGKIIFPYQLLADTVFYTECGPQLPSIFRFKQERNTNYWVGDQFNYLQLSKLQD